MPAPLARRMRKSRNRKGCADAPPSDGIGCIEPLERFSAQSPLRRSSSYAGSFQLLAVCPLVHTGGLFSSGRFWTRNSMKSGKLSVDDGSIRDDAVVIVSRSGSNTILALRGGN